MHLHQQIAHQVQPMTCTYRFCPLTYGSDHMSDSDFADEVTVRVARRADVSDLHAALQALAVVEHSVGEVRATEDELARALFDDHLTHAFVAYVGTSFAGCLLWVAGYSSWICRPTRELTDLYVHEGFRSRGVASALYRALVAEAASAGAGRIDWWVRVGNSNAERFYRAMGGYERTEWTPWRADL